MDLLIADGRTVEARAYAEAMKAVENTYHYELYMANICKAECDLPNALDWMKKMTEHEPENWLVWASYADHMAKLCRYDEAIENYKKAMPMRPKPRFYDCEEAVAHIYEIQGNISGAIEMTRQALELVREDWSPEGEEVDHFYREIRRLEGIL
jgi:tetratricopeptide (TPR) repeat protein